MKSSELIACETRAQIARIADTIGKLLTGHLGGIRLAWIRSRRAVVTSIAVRVAIFIVLVGIRSALAVVGSVEDAVAIEIVWIRVHGRRAAATRTDQRDHQRAKLR